MQCTKYILYSLHILSILYTVEIILNYNTCLGFLPYHKFIFLVALIELRYALNTPFRTSVFLKFLSLLHYELLSMFIIYISLKYSIRTHCVLGELGMYLYGARRGQRVEHVY